MHPDSSFAMLHVQQCLAATPCREVFEALDRTEGILAKQRWIAGDQFTEADIRLFVTLIRVRCSCACCCILAMLEHLWLTACGMQFDHVYEVRPPFLSPPSLPPCTFLHSCMVIFITA